MYKVVGGVVVVLGLLVMNVWLRLLLKRLLGLKVDHCDYLLGGSGCYYVMNYLFL